MQMIFSCEFIMDLWLFDIGEVLARVEWRAN